MEQEELDPDGVSTGEDYDEEDDEDSKDIEVIAMAPPAADVASAVTNSACHES